MKEQLFKIEGDEFKDVNLGYVDKDTGETHIINVPEHEALSIVEGDSEKSSTAARVFTAPQPPKERSNN